MQYSTTLMNVMMFRNTDFQLNVTNSSLKHLSRVFLLKLRFKVDLTPQSLTLSLSNFLFLLAQLQCYAYLDRDFDDKIIIIWQLEIVISILKDTSLFRVTIFPLTQFKSLRQQKLTLPKLKNIAKKLKQKIFEALANITCISEYLMYMFKNLMCMFQFVKIL